MGPKEVCSTVLNAGEEALCVAFRKHTLLPLDDCLYALQSEVPPIYPVPPCTVCSSAMIYRAYRRRMVTSPGRSSRLI